MTRIKIPDIRSNAPEDYDHAHRLGQLKRSWPIGVEQQTDGDEGISIRNGLSWGSIGQILGYLLGEVDEEFQEDLYDRMLNQFNGESLSGSPGQPAEENTNGKTRRSKAGR